MADIVSESREATEPNDQRAAVDERHAACGRLARLEQPDVLQAVDHLTHGCQMFGRDYRCLYANAAAERHERLSSEQLLNRDHTEVWASSAQSGIGAWLEHCVQSQTGHVLERERALPDGSRAWFELHIEPVPQGAFVMSIDISARKRIECMQDEQREQLRQSQTIEWIAQLAGRIAHELNNMLSVILNCAEFACQELGETHSLRPLLEQIATAGQRATVLTRKLTTFAQQQAASAQVIELNTFIESLLPSLVRDSGLSNDVELRWKPGATLWSVYIDPAQLEQALANLFRHARDAMSDRGTISIETRTLHIDAAQGQPGLTSEPGPTGDVVRISVHDDGRGMHPATKARIFEPLCPGNRRGGGLGLATVYGIVKQNHGSMYLDSEPSGGTTFVIDFPRCMVEPKHNFRAPEWSAQQACVLVVDDEPLVLASCARMLETLGYRVLSAGTAEDAVRLVREQSRAIDVVLTDVVMPNMHGPELAERLLAISPNIAVLFTSGSGEQVLAQHGIESESCHFIRKPCTLDELDSKIRQVYHERIRT
jgi:two-component system cell cycle sensor histidine kinase/response regulator CckA